MTEITYDKTIAHDCSDDAQVSDAHEFTAGCGCANCAATEVQSNAEASAATHSSAALSTYSLDQIATHLTDDYWASINAGQRSFDTGTEHRLYVDISDLQSAGQDLARHALDAWSAVTGITFTEVESRPDPTAITTERRDAENITTTRYSINVGEAFDGTLSTGTDRDAVAVTLTAGQNYTVTLSGNDSKGNATTDPFLRIFNENGHLVAFNDDSEGRDSRVAFSAETTGTYFMQAGSFYDSHAGDYRLMVSASGGPAADLIFADQDAGAYAMSTVLGAEITSSFINIDQGWAGGEHRLDGYHFQTYLHEIGHALGLGHTGHYNGSATFADDALFANDSWSVSVMSYFHQAENTASDASFAYAITPMMADIIAAQNLYGVGAQAEGDTVYGRNGTSGSHVDRALDFSNDVTWTVYDTDGTDHFDFGDFVQDQRIDMRAETSSDVAGLKGNMSIARNTVVEKATTGAGHDVVVGNDVANSIWSGDGDDTVSGGNGDDAIFGGAGLDELSGGDGFDLIVGGQDASYISGDGGSDFLIGGDITLDLLTAHFPEWNAPADAQAHIDAEQIDILWEDILMQAAEIA